MKTHFSFYIFFFNYPHLLKKKVSLLGLFFFVFYMWPNNNRGGKKSIAYTSGIVKCKQSFKTVVQTQYALIPLYEG